MTHPKLCIMFPSNTSYHIEILLLSYCSLWLILFWIKVLLSPLSDVVTHIASVSRRLCISLRLDNSAMPSHIHKNTHTNQPQGEKKMQRLTSVCGREHQLNLWIPGGHQSGESKQKSDRHGASALIGCTDWIQADCMCFNSHTHLADCF